MRITLALCFGWVAGLALFGAYDLTHSFPQWICPVAATAITFVVLRVLKA
jgi:hypothetical protein